MNEYLNSEERQEKLNILYMSDEKYHKDIYKMPYRNCSIQTINLSTFDSKISNIYLLKEENKNILSKKCDIFVLDSSYGLSNIDIDMVKKIIAKNEALYNTPVCGIYVFNFKDVQMVNLYYIKNGSLIEKEEIVLPNNTHGLDLLNISLLEIEGMKVKQKIKR